MLRLIGFIKTEQGHFTERGRLESTFVTYSSIGEAVAKMVEKYDKVDVSIIRKEKEE